MLVVSFPSAFAELDVGAGVQLTRCMKRLDVAGTPLHIEATLNHQGTKPASRQVQGREQASRPQAHHNDAAVLRLGRS